MQRPTPWLATTLVLAVTLSLGPTATSAESEEAPQAADGVTVVLEVWRTSDAGLAKRVEALTDANPADAVAVRKAVASSDKASRVSRFVTPTQIGKPMMQSDRAEKPVQVSGPTVGGLGRAGGFGGFVSEGSELEFAVRTRPEGRLATQLKLNVTAMGKPRQVPGGAVIPGDRFRAEIEGAVAGPSGTTRMFVSHSASNDVVLVFVTATKL